MDRRGLLWAVVVAALVLFGPTSCRETPPAGGLTNAATAQTPTAAPADGESAAAAPAAVLADWPELLPEEDTTLSTGIVGQIINKAPPTIMVGDCLIRPGETAQATIKLGRGFGRTTVKEFGGAKLIVTDAAGAEVFSGRTDEKGQLLFERKFDAEGNHFFRVKAAGKVDDADVAPVLFCVYVRAEQTPLAVCDLDKTLVMSGFERVMVGMAKPFDHAADVLGRLVAEKKMTIVYLTHRPDFFEASSRMWIRKNRFPPGPLFTSDVKGLLEGSGSFKTAEIARLKERFPNIQLAVGDKYSDIAAYVTNKIPSVLIPDIQWDKDKRKYWQETLTNLETVNEDVPVCRNWFEIEEALFKDVKFPPKRLIDKVRDTMRLMPMDD
ncbi:MAG TPA: hypothetical protein PLP01_02620 [Phycisphaerae bacterium]|nr:hypothetical protein [Phycisphaerae bacterium]